MSFSSEDGRFGGAFEVRDVRVRVSFFFGSATPVIPGVKSYQAELSATLPRNRK